MSLDIDVKISEAQPFAERCDALVLFVPEGTKKSFDVFVAVDRRMKKALSGVLKEERFQGKLGETILFHGRGGIAARNVLLTGIGKTGEITEEVFRRASASAVQAARRAACGRVAFTVPAGLKVDETSASRSVLEGALLGAYRFVKFKTKQEEIEPGKKIKSISLLARRTPVLKETIARVRLCVEATYQARDLVNEPPNVLNPAVLADIARATAEEKGLNVRVIEAPELESLGAGAILGVGSGSRVPPRLIELSYSSGKENARKIALVGKGITFDSGGLSLKSSKLMESMKCDMAGAAAVLCAMSALSEIKPDCDVIGVLCAAENMPSGSAIRPGDVLRAMNGKSIEIINTDAEGRLVLADGLAWAVKQGATEIIDLATLTGACVIGLGPYIAGAMGNDNALLKRIVDAGKIVGEMFWELPILNEYDFMVKSDIADIKNLAANNEAGAIQGALFLREFIGNAKWVHLDIAGPAWYEKEFFHIPKNGTGFGVRTLLQYLSNSSK